MFHGDDTTRERMFESSFRIRGAQAGVAPDNPGVSERTIRIRVGVLIWRDGEVDGGETMIAAGAGEVFEETGYPADMGRLLIVCEAIDPKPGGRHIVNT